jgi:DNA polymerase III alpha subunit
MTPDCIVHVEDYAKRAKELGHTTISALEHGYAGNIFEYYTVSQQYNLKMIFGMEYYYVTDRYEKDRTNTHLLVMAKNPDGMKQMNSILSEANKTGYYYKARIDKELLISLDPNDVLVTTACIGDYIAKYDDYEENYVEPLLNHFGKNFYLEIQYHIHPKQIEHNQKLQILQNKYHIPFIHANDSHYIYPKQSKDRDELLAGKNIHYDDEEGFVLDYPDSDTIYQRYEKQGVFTKDQITEALKNTLVMDDFEDINVDKEIKMPSIYPGWSHEKKFKKLVNIVGEEWLKDKKHIDQKNYKKYQDAIKFELKIIKDTKMEDYFLLNSKIIKRAKELGGVLTRTGRGSAPSFYLNKLLGFTEVDRLAAPITLYPTRFMSKTRILETKSLPDIDMNCVDPEPFREATREILGNDNVYWMVAYGTMKESEAFRNYCRAKNLPMVEYNTVGKDLDSYRNNPKWKDTIEESEKFVGVIDSVSPHPCSNLLLSKPISKELGVIKVGDAYCALIDSHTSDSFKYLKNDFLTVKVWKIISEAFKLINKPIPDVRELTKLVTQDNDVWNLYKNGITATLNQAGSNSGTPQVIQYQPKSIRELSGWVAAIRPSFASMKSYFLNREPFSYGIHEFDKLLQQSDNFILYQENIMEVLVYAGFDEDETYSLLKAIAKKTPGIIEPIHDRFIKGFMDKTGSQENADRVWEIIQDAVGYGFNASHAYSVALDSLYGAYLKAKYPIEYYTVVLQLYDSDTTMTSKLMNELKYFHIKLFPPKYGYSKGEYFFDKDKNAIYKGIGSIKFLNNDVGTNLYNLSKELKFDTFSDLLFKIKNESYANSRQIKILTTLNYFDKFGDNGKLLKIIDKFESRLKNKNLKDETKQKRLIEVKEFEDSLDEIKLNIKEQIKFEMEYYGYEVSIANGSPENVYMITELDTKYTPRLRLYNLKTGKIKSLKCKKKDIKLNPFGEFSMIQVKGIIEKFKNKLVDGKWTKSEEMEPFLTSWSVIE